MPPKPPSIAGVVSAAGRPSISSASVPSGWRATRIARSRQRGSR
jgi:hypothetical protein